MSHDISTVPVLFDLTSLTPLSRRSWLAVAASTLAGCGGGSGGIAGIPGTGGTGVYAQGSIAGFGSVILNGIKFDDTAAVVQVDGVTVSPASLRLGMVASVQGQRGADLTLGVASSIEVWSVAQGPVRQVQAGQFMLAGMTVQTDLNTAFDGVMSTTGLTAGQTVAVWGLQAGTDGQRWTATRVAVVTATPVVCSGMVVASGGLRYLNGVVLTGAVANGLLAGQLVRVLGALSANGSTLAVTSVRGIGGVSADLTGVDAELEGLVTTKLSSTRFLLGNIEVDASTATFVASAATFLQGTVPITVGMRIEAYGTWQGQVLKATSIEIENEESPQVVEIKASISTFTSLANFVLRGQRCDATGAVVSGGLVSSLKAGVTVKVKGTKNGDVLVVTSMAIGTATDD
jgi:Domain of unknown function (DUF5666)